MAGAGWGKIQVHTLQYSSAAFLLAWSWPGGGALAFREPSRQTPAANVVELTDLTPAPEVAALAEDTMLAGGLPTRVEPGGTVTFLGSRPLGAPSPDVIDRPAQIEALRDYFARASADGIAEIAHVATHEEQGDGRLVHIFTQMHHGLPVLGTWALAKVQKNNLVYAHHFLVDPEALDGTADRRNRGIDAARATTVAGAFSARSAAQARLAEPPRRAWLHLNGRFTLVWDVAMHTDRPYGKWQIFVDAERGEVVGRKKMSLDGVHGTVTAQVEPACQGEPAAQVPLPFAPWTDGGTTDEIGTFRAATELARARVHLDGPYVRIESMGGELPWELTAELAEEPAVNNLDSPRAPNAQGSAWVHVHTARAWLRDRLRKTDLGGADDSRIWRWTENPLTVRVDLPGRSVGDGCNAFYDGDALNFYAADAHLGCNNTARVAKIVYHEYAHAIHDQLTASRSTYNEQVSEGIADYFAASITGDPRMTGLTGCNDTVKARKNLRTCENKYNYCRLLRCDSRPGDEQHNAGPVLCGALWDLRKALVKRYGEQKGSEVAERLFLRFLALVTDMNSSYTAAIAADDDDDNNPANGTRHSCEINEAFLGDDGGAEKKRGKAHFPEAKVQKVPCVR